ncbi:MAG TPA: hypothetical protein VH054_11190, partial [Polyangiaceae bacterium]|nr:hypothetical protein [Polyangiaceae bacterium]
MRRALATALLGAALALAAACFTPPKVGDSCNDAVVSCFDAKTALECVGGVRIGVHCGGPT